MTTNTAIASLTEPTEAFVEDTSDKPRNSLCLKVSSHRQLKSQIERFQEKIDDLKEKVYDIEEEMKLQIPAGKHYIVRLGRYFVDVEHSLTTRSMHIEDVTVVS